LKNHQIPRHPPFSKGKKGFLSKDIQKRSPPFGKGRTGGDTGALENLKNMEGG
jgi:hypothetical protein